MEGRPLDEAELVERARRGDGDAYGELVQRYSDLAFRTAFLVTSSAADAEDAAQEAFVAAYRALPTFRPGAPLRPWLLRIVVNASRNRRRAAARREGLALRVADAVDAGDAAPSPERAVEVAEERTALLRAVGDLKDDDREVIACRYFLELSVEETAAALGCRQGTVKSRLSRALLRLRVAMESADG